MVCCKKLHGHCGVTGGISFPIDLVYLWVDGTGAKFRALKNQWMRKTHVAKCDKYLDDTEDTIYRNNDELKYSLRSVAKNAPWVNHIYIVTGFGQVPKWLNTKNRRITIVPQESILPPDASPVFNSCAVEACLTNIPGLSEHFLLANDDMFFNMPVKPDYFFDAPGTAKVRCIYRKNGRVARDAKSIYLQLLINSAREIESAFNIPMYNYKSSHSIDPYIKSSMVECCNHPILSESINATKFHKFRDETDVHRWIFNLYDVLHNRARLIVSHSKHVGHHRVLDFLYNMIHYKSIREAPFYCTDAIESSVFTCRAPIVCVNDSIYSSDVTRDHNRKFFEAKFPDKSKFEK